MEPNTRTVLYSKSPYTKFLFILILLSRDRVESEKPTTEVPEYVRVSDKNVQYYYKTTFERRIEVLLHDSMTAAADGHTTTCWFAVASLLT